MAKKQIEVIDQCGAKTVAKKTSVITWAKRIFLVVTILWLPFAAWFPLYVKDHYGQPIKKAIVVSMFFDLQRNINEQYENLLALAKKNINLEKPINAAIDKVKLAEKPVAKVESASASAKGATAKVSAITGVANKFGINTGAADKVVGSANNAIAQVDDVTAMVNKQLDKTKSELQKIAQTEVDKAIDEQVKKFLDSNSGGLGTTLLTNYGQQHIYPWRPSDWPLATRIYNDISKSSLSVVQILTRTVDQYFGYVAWGLVFVGWFAGLFIWMIAFKKFRQVTSPFIVCPRCGHTFTDKRTGWMLLNFLMPWKYFM